MEIGVETDFNKDTNDFGINSLENETMIFAYIDIQDKQIKLTYSSTANDGESSEKISKEITINSPGGGVREKRTYFIMIYFIKTNERVY